MSEKLSTSNALSHEQAQTALRRGDRKVQDHQTEEWSSGTRGGGKVPADFGWATNPKQYQEEFGSSTLEEEKDLERERASKR